MNHIYRSIWSEALKTWVAIPENTASKGKRSSVKNAVIASGLMAVSSAAFALPTGEQVVAGQVTVNTPTATQMNIHQGSQNAVVNWNGFSIAQPETVNIQQPNAQAAILNRVVGVDASVIQGHLNANGQVYLVNPNGVLFSNTAQVDVGGLVASTHNISNVDFLSGNNHFTQDGATGSVSNQGRITVPVGGTVALIGTQLSNEGTISTPQGSTVLAAGKTVDLDFKGNGLVEVKIPEAALNAQIANSGAIMADGGRVVLSAQSANALADTVINQSGVIQARSLSSRNGEIVLLGGQNGTVQVAGKLDASASGTANGGFIETSGAHVKVADAAQITTQAASGLNGTWLIDPVDFTIAATGGDISGTTLSTNLGSGNVSIASSSGTHGGTSGDINVNDAVSWSANNTLTLNAQRNININANISSYGTTGKLSLLCGQASASGGATGNYFVNAAVNLAAGQNFSTQRGSNVANLIDYTVITSLGAAGDETTGSQTLQGMAAKANLKTSYVLGANIDATATAGWNAGAGFMPIGTPTINLVGNLTNRFRGIFDGLGHTITGLTINRPSTKFVGLFGSSTNAISNVGLLNGNVSGSEFVGMLTAVQYGSNVSNVYATGNVSGQGAYVGGLMGANYGLLSNSYATDNVKGGATFGNFAQGGVGGLVGTNFSTVSNAYATGSVTGNTDVGGLVGTNFSTVSNAYATGSVTGNTEVGGLVGFNKGGTISNTYATGSVTGTTNVGGLVGVNKQQVGVVTNSFWDTTKSGLGEGLGIGSNNGTAGVAGTPQTGVAGKTTTQMMQAATFSSAGWDIASTGGSNAVWRIYEGSTAPLLRSFLTPLIAYSDGTYSLANVNTGNLFGSGTGAYSNQQGYDISYAVVPPKPPVVPVVPKAPTVASTQKVPDLDDQLVLLKNSTTKAPFLSRTNQFNSHHHDSHHEDESMTEIDSKALIEIENHGIRFPQVVNGNRPI